MKDLLDCLKFIVTEFFMRFFRAIGLLWMTCVAPYVFETAMLIMFIIYRLMRG